LRAAIKKLQNQREVIQSQIADYEKYLQGCRENAAKKAKEKKKTVKFSHKELTKIKIILESNLSEEEYVPLLIHIHTSSHPHTHTLTLSLSYTHTFTHSNTNSPIDYILIVR
jgi:hypothetical protein